MDKHTSAEHRTAESSSGGATLPAAATLEVATIINVVYIMIEDYEQCEKEITEEHRHHDREHAKECRRYEEESERHITEITKKLELLCEMITARAIAAPLGAQRERESVKLTCLSDNNDSDDIEAYLTTFEIMM